MKLTRARITVRRIMIAVAVVALVFAFYVGLEPRRVRFHRRANQPLALVVPIVTSSRQPGPTFASANGRYHHDLYLKYERAARYPWLPVMPDLPGPK